MLLGSILPSPGEDSNDVPSIGFNLGAALPVLPSMQVMLVLLIFQDNT